MASLFGGFSLSLLAAVSIVAALRSSRWPRTVLPHSSATSNPSSNSRNSPNGSASAPGSRTAFVLNDVV